MRESIYTIDTDWIAEAASVLQRKHVERGDETDDMECTVSIVYLPDAYRGCPCHVLRCMLLITSVRGS